MAQGAPDPFFPQRRGFLHEVLDELARARLKHPGEEGVLTDAEWLAVLTEEVGECARAIQDEGDDALRAELAQVAAVAMRWALSIPHGRQRPPWAVRASRFPACPRGGECHGDCEPGCSA